MNFLLFVSPTCAKIPKNHFSHFPSTCTPNLHPVANLEKLKQPSKEAPARSSFAGAAEHFPGELGASSRTVFRRPPMSDGALPPCGTVTLSLHPMGNVPKRSLSLPYTLEKLKKKKATYWKTSLEVPWLWLKDHGEYAWCWKGTISVQPLGRNVTFVSTLMFFPHGFLVLVVFLCRTSGVVRGRARSAHQD